jgi:acyl carrier protein
VKRNDIISRLNEIFEDIIDEGPVLLLDTSTTDDVAGWDSLTNIQLVVEIESHYNIRFTSEEIIVWKNVGEMIDCIIQKGELNGFST